MGAFIQISILLMIGWSGPARAASAQPPTAFVGFDRNDYPGDSAMAELRKNFSFAGFWLTPSPFGKTNSWTGKREAMVSQGYGFLLLARGRQVNSIRNAGSGRDKGVIDAQVAARNAKVEGFAIGAIIFLDIEDGGRLPQAYHAYLKAWSDELQKLGFRPGIYCSGSAVDEGGGISVVTAEDIRLNEAPRQFSFWVFNDSCPPSPGCVSLANPPPPSVSGVKDAAVWQFVRSPREKETAAACRGYAADENCYAPSDAARRWNLDLDIASSTNPSYAN